MVLTIYNVLVARWELNVHHRTQIYLWESLNNATYILELRKKHAYSCATLTIYFSFEQEPLFLEQQLESFLKKIN